MTQDASDEKEEEEVVDIELCEDMRQHHGRILPSFENIGFSPNMLSVYPNIGDFPRSIVKREDFNVKNDDEVDRAIQQINSKLETIEYTPEETAHVADAVDELHDEENLELKRKLLEEHNLRIVQQLLASDTGALSPKEVQFRNKGIISESTVRDHLRNLTEEGFAEKLEPDVESIPNRMPRTFYAASPFAIELLQEMGLWENLGMLYQIYDSLERPEEIRLIEEWEERPTPDWM